MADSLLTITSIKPFKDSQIIGLIISLILKTIASGGLSPNSGTFGN